MFFSAEFLGRSIIDFILEISRGVLQIYLGKFWREFWKRVLTNQGLFAKLVVDKKGKKVELMKNYKV